MFGGEQLAMAVYKEKVKTTKVSRLQCYISLPRGRPVVCSFRETFRFSSGDLRAFSISF